MLPTPLGLRLDPSRPIREQIREAARLGARGVVLDAVGDLAPARLSETGRRELRHLLRSVELTLIALNLPTRRPFDTTDQLDDRLNRAEAAFALAYELGTNLVLARVGGIPPEADAAGARDVRRRRPRAGPPGRPPGRPARRRDRPRRRASRSRALLDGLASPGLAASLDPAALLQHGHDPIAVDPGARPLGRPRLRHRRHLGLGRRARPAAAACPPGALDWHEYLGALEEVNYRGYLTIWPDPAREPGPQFTADRRPAQAALNARPAGPAVGVLEPAVAAPRLS